MTWMDADAPAQGCEDRSNDAPESRAGQPSRVPNPEMVAKPDRHHFPAKCRLRIVEEAHRSTRTAPVARLFARDGLYASYLSVRQKAPRIASLQGSVQPRYLSHDANVCSVTANHHRPSIHDTLPTPQLPFTNKQLNHAYRSFRTVESWNSFLPALDLNLAISELQALATIE